MKGKHLMTALAGLFGSKEGLCALLFLGCLLFGGGTVLFGGLRTKTACAGWTRPEIKTLQKADPAIPHREWDPAGSGVLGGVKRESAKERFQDWTAKAEKTAGTALEDQHFFINLYGGVQRALGRTFVEDQADPNYGVARLRSGQLTFVGTGEPDPEEQAADLKRFQLALADRDIKLLYVQAPSKLEPGEEVLPYGVDDTSNQSVDRLLAALREVGVEYLDLRQVLSVQSGRWSENFYDTDHHWNQEGAFAAFQAIAMRLEGYRPRTPAPGHKVPHPFRVDRTLLDRDSYDQTVLEDYFLGSQGKRVGTLYAGVDDFTLWSPRFATLLRYRAPDGYIDDFGALDSTVLFEERLEETDYFKGNPYTYYAGSDYPITWITNYYNTDGPRVVLLRDSYACAVTPYLALACKQLVTIDPRYFWGDELTYIRRIDPDVVIVMFSPGMVRNQEGVRFMEQPVTSGKRDSMRWNTTLRGEEGEDPAK